eukprot:g6051.t1
MSFWRGCPWPVALLLLRLTGGAADDSPPRVFQPDRWLPPVLECPENCEALFRNLEDDTNVAGRKFQHVAIQARGELQGGLSFMFKLASETLGQSCMFLMRAYGRESCRVEWTDHKRTLIFEPWRAEDAAAGGGKAPQCSCDTISSVTIDISSEDKYLLPCDDSCAWSRDISSPRPNEPVCVFRDDRPLENHAGLLQCMEEAACPITDDRMQMAVFRDPRAAAASLFFRMQREHPEALEKAGLVSVDNFFLAVLPSLCKWTSVRHRLFADAVASPSIVYWYEEVLESTFKWYYNLLYYLGLAMPAAVVEWVLHTVTSKPHEDGFFAAAAGGDDERLVKEGVVLSTNRTFRDDISAESLQAADDILRVWLPPVLQEKLGVPEA